MILLGQNEMSTINWQEYCCENTIKCSEVACYQWNCTLLETPLK